MAVVVDTDVISFQFKGDSCASLYDLHLAGHILVVPFMSLAELDHWAVQNNWVQNRRDSLLRHLSRFVLHNSVGLCAPNERSRDYAGVLGLTVLTAAIP